MASQNIRLEGRQRVKSFFDEARVVNCFTWRDLDFTSLMGLTLVWVRPKASRSISTAYAFGSLELLSENHDFEKASVFEPVARGFKTVFQVECALPRALFIVVCARIVGFDVKRDGLFWIALLRIVEIWVP